MNSNQFSIIYHSVYLRIWYLQTGKKYGSECPSVSFEKVSPNPLKLKAIMLCPTHVLHMLSYKLYQVLCSFRPPRPWGWHVTLHLMNSCHVGNTICTSLDGSISNQGIYFDIIVAVQLNCIQQIPGKEL